VGGGRLGNRLVNEVLHIDMARGGGRLVAFGEAMIRSMPDVRGNIRETPGGSEWNVAIATARLGRDASWVSTVPHAPAGWRLIREESENAGLDIDDLQISTGSNSIGRYDVNPIEKSVRYHRADSAFANLDRGSYDWHRYLDGARWLVTSGITPLLGHAPKSAWSAALTFAEMEGVLNVFDMNHRPELGTLEQLWGEMISRMRQFHVVVTSPETLDGIARIEGWPEPENNQNRIEIMEKIRDLTLLPHLCCCFKESTSQSQTNVSLTNGLPDESSAIRKMSQFRWSAVAHSFGADDTRDMMVLHTPVEPLGGGDAWLAGYLDGLTEFGNRPSSPVRAASRADLLAALAQSTFGDASQVTRSMLVAAEQQRDCTE
jgi:sugar/nucleoside kinase (ribokinase family)